MRNFMISRWRFDLVETSPKRDDKSFLVYNLTMNTTVASIWAKTHKKSYNFIDPESRYNRRLNPDISGVGTQRVNNDIQGKIMFHFLYIFNETDLFRSSQVIFDENCKFWPTIPDNVTQFSRVYPIKVQTTSNRKLI